MKVFEKIGAENTQETIKLTLEYAKENNIKTIVVASYTGYVADYFKDVKDFNIIIVRGTYGFSGENHIRMSEQAKTEYESLGMKVVTAAHALSGAERGLSAKFTGVYPVEIIAHTLRMFGQGTKVCVECATMAADGGYIQTGEKVISIAGSGKGADTALVMKATTSNKILETKICEYICKPSL